MIKKIIKTIIVATLLLMLPIGALATNSTATNTTSNNSTLSTNLSVSVNSTNNNSNTTIVPVAVVANTTSNSTNTTIVPVAVVANTTNNSTNTTIQPVAVVANTTSNNTTESNVNSSNVITSEDSKLISSSLGAHIRLLQLQNRVDFQVESAGLILGKITQLNKTSQFNMTRLNNDVNSLRAISIAISDYNFTTATENQTATEFVAMKKEAITLTQDFKKTIGNGLSASEKADLARLIAEKDKIRKEIGNPRIAKLVSEYNHKQLLNIAQKFKLNNSKIIAGIQNGSISPNMLKKEVENRFNHLNATEREDIRANLTEDQIKANIALNKQKGELEKEVNKLKSNIQKQIQERRSEIEKDVNENIAQAQNMSAKMNDDLKNLTQERQDLREQIIQNKRDITQAKIQQDKKNLEKLKEARDGIMKKVTNSPDQIPQPQANQTSGGDD